MAQYSGRDYGRNTPNANFGPSSATQRDTAFSQIFGGAPPGGRSHTMTSNTHAGPNPNADRAVTMSNASRAPPPQQQQQQQQTNGYPPPQHQQYPGPQQPQQYPQPYDRRPLPPPQNLPQPIRPDRTTYGAPQRLDPRAPGGGGGPPSSSQYPRSFSQQRPYAPGVGPSSSSASLNSDPYRSQSLATTPRPQYAPPPSTTPGAPANAFRQQTYLNHNNRTTAQGRIVPERAGDERTMSMSSYTHDYERQIPQSGRVIPTRRRESEEPELSNAYHPERIPTIGGAQVANGRLASMSSARTMSMASTIVAPPPERPGINTAITDRTMSMASTTTTAKTPTTAASTMVAQKRPSLVYGALLSNVAAAFRERIALIDEREKDGLVYANAFTGYEAVELLAYIIRTSDRNLALLLGRSLDAQKFFHEVAYAHRLRDSPTEVYQFRELGGGGSLGEDAAGEVNGVFTLLTECYSPTCNRDNLCYSIACPRRLEQQQRLNMKVSPGLTRSTSKSSLHDEAESNEQKLWINTVSKDVSDSVSESERKRQEVISELMYTERDFVKDLEYLRDFWIKPLRTPETSPIPEHRREKFIRTVFSNCQEVHAVNARMASALTRRQQQSPVVRAVGDIFLEYVGQFAPFVKYGANQLFGKFEFEREKASNPAFARFVEETERLKESRKLELNGYLTKPTTRLARYPLLLENVLKATAEGEDDKKDVPKAIKSIRETLTRVNEESGKAENHFNLMTLNNQLKWGAIPHMDLKLTEETRQLIFKSNLKKTPQSEQADVGAYLFDHAVLLVRTKVVGKKEEVRVYRKPIPLELLVIKEMDAVLPRPLGASVTGSMVKRPSASMIPGVGRSTTAAARAAAAGLGVGAGEGGAGVYPITFKGLGKGGYELTLYCTSPIQREKWMEHIQRQKRLLADRHKIFAMSKVLGEGSGGGFFSAASGVRVNCCRPIDGGRKLVIGTDVGVFIAERGRPDVKSVRPRRVLEAKLVTQIEVLEQHSILVVLADKAVTTYPLEALETDDVGPAAAAAKRGRRICHANYINAGTCNGQTLVCCVKSSSLSSTVKVFEPLENLLGRTGKKKSGFAKMLAGGQEVLKPYKEFYIPMESNSVHFLRSKLCVGGAKGFEIVSLETLETQSLLDQADTSLDFITRPVTSGNPPKPIYIERTSSEFLLCYNDFSFYVNKNGWRARGDWKILWEGRPEAFATWGEKWILAFEGEFVEVRSAETGGLVGIFCWRGVRFLHQSTREVSFDFSFLSFWEGGGAGAGGDALGVDNG